MNALKRHAVLAEQRANEEQVVEVAQAFERESQSLEHRVKISQSDTFAEIKARAEEMLEDMRKGWIGMSDMVEIHRLQGAERALGALLGYYDTAMAQLRKLRSHMDGAEGNG